MESAGSIEYRPRASKGDRTAQGKDGTVCVLLSDIVTSSRVAIKDAANISQKQYTDLSIKVGSWGLLEEVLRTGQVRCSPHSDWLWSRN